jgi:hypothetical protein
MLVMVKGKFWESSFQWLRGMTNDEFGAAGGLVIGVDDSTLSGLVNFCVWLPGVAAGASTPGWMIAILSGFQDASDDSGAWRWTRWVIPKGLNQPA